EVAAILDWEYAVIGPREYDVWIAAEGQHLTAFLDEYGAHDLDLDHLEYALLSRALRDLAARVLSGVDRPGVDTWGFDRIARLDRDLQGFRAYCWAGAPGPGSTSMSGACIGLPQLEHVSSTWLISPHVWWR